MRHFTDLWGESTEQVVLYSDPERVSPPSKPAAADGIRYEAFIAVPEGPKLSPVNVT
jgi:hypothetical protein